MLESYQRASQSLERLDPVQENDLLGVMTASIRNLSECVYTLSTISKILEDYMTSKPDQFQRTSKLKEIWYRQLNQNLDMSRFNFNKLVTTSKAIFSCLDNFDGFMPGIVEVEEFLAEEENRKGGIETQMSIIEIQEFFGVKKVD